jgi:hypothetical protein
MHENHKLAIPEQKAEAEIALAIHYLDPELNDERTGDGCRLDSRDFGHLADMANRRIDAYLL